MRMMRGPLTQRQFSVRYEIPLQTLKQWEQGVSEPYDWVKKMICNFVIPPPPPSWGEYVQGGLAEAVKPEKKEAGGRARKST